MKEFVVHLARALVNNSEEEDVTETQGRTGTLLELRVAAEDLGRRRRRVQLNKGTKTATGFCETALRFRS